MIENNLVVNYIDKCFLVGKKAPKDICATASIEFKEVDEQLKKLKQQIKELEPKKHLLVSVLRSFDQDVPNEKIVLPPAILTEVSFTDLEEEARSLVIKTCDFLQNSWKDKIVVLPRQIMEALKIEEDQDYKLINAIKWLGLKGIITRSKEKNIIEGPNWEKRPQ